MANNDAATTVDADKDKEEKERQSKCLQNIRTAHRSYDSATLDIQQCLEKASASPFVSSQLLAKLKDEFDKAAKLDEQLVGLDKSSRQKEALDIGKSKVTIQASYDGLKECKALCGKINPLL